jgi:TonB family protein
LSPIIFPRSSETKLTPVKETFAAEKEAIESEEVVAEAVEHLLSQDLSKQESPLHSFTDEPRSVSFPQNIQDGHHPFDQAQDRLKSGAHLDPQTPHTETKRSFVIGGKAQDDMTISPRSHIGIVVKEETLPHTQEPDVTLQEDDVLERIAIDEVDTSSFTIEGPASRREVLYKPTWLPEVHIDVEVDIRLKFWVLPDGTVGEVIPLQRGDVRLERAAIEYLKNWRFTPVASDTPKAWGIIPIKYKLQ